MELIDRNFYMRDGITVAKELLGKYIIKTIGDIKTCSKIVEVEAYMGSIDKASHAYKGKTDRNRIMFGPPGFAYVYFIYGMYHCLNFVSNKEGKAEAVLIRAVEPIKGFNEMSYLRYGREYESLNKREKLNLTNGPSKLCIALGIDKSFNGHDLLNTNFYIAKELEESFEIVETKRINIDYAEEAIDFPWRFYIKGNPYISKK